MYHIWKLLFLYLFDMYTDMIHTWIIQKSEAQILVVYGALVSSFSETYQQGIGPYYYTEVVDHKLMYK